MTTTATRFDLMHYLVSRDRDTLFVVYSPGVPAEVEVIWNDLGNVAGHVTTEYPNGTLATTAVHVDCTSNGKCYEECPVGSTYRKASGELLVVTEGPDGSTKWLESE